MAAPVTLVQCDQYIGWMGISSGWILDVARTRLAGPSHSEGAPMRAFAAAIPLTLALSLFAASCGSDSKTAPASTIPRADICNQGSQAACAKVFSCSATEFPVLSLVQLGLGGSEAACRTMVQAQYCGAFQCATASAYNGAKAGECKTQFGNVSCQMLSATAGAAITQGVSAILGSLPGCDQICSGSGSDAATGQ